MGYQEALEGESNRTAFRKAEKKYKLYKAISGSVFRGGNAKLPIQDFSDVLDFHKIFAFFKESGNPVPGFTINLDQKWPVITLEDRPGFYFIPGALSMEEQFYWIKESLTTFPQPPNRTNHNQFQGPIHDLWTAAQNNKVLVEMRNSNVDSESVKTNDDCCNSSWIFIDEKDVQSRKSKGVPPSKSIPAKALLRKMRWATLGLQFDWSERNYDASLPHDEIPDALCHLAKELAMPAMHDQEFSAEAAIVNYFACDDTLGGHLDDMEKDWSKPIVSISLGCKAIFLLGGPSREDPPIAMFLRSGDAILMAGSARQCFHGVPRIFADENSGVPTFEKLVSDPADFAFVDYIKKSRININIRQAGYISEGNSHASKTSSVEEK